MQLNELLAEVDALKVEIEKLRPLKPEVEHRILQKFRLDWNYHSNAIEGNSLTPGETRAFLLEGLTASGKPLKDHLDIKGHNELIDFLHLYIQRKEELTEAAIREMHKILLREPYDTEAVTLDGKIVKKRVELGKYKTTPNFVRMGSGQVHQYAAPEDVVPRIGELIAVHRAESVKNDFHPLPHAAWFHHQFLAIHPFDDGNGRLGRILMNLILMRHGFPPVVIKLQQREPYVAALRQADANDIKPLVSFVGECLLDSERLFLRGARGESIEDSDDIEKQVTLLKQELQNTPKPVELTQKIQLALLKHKLAPLHSRIDGKVRQFDDMFASNALVISLATDVTPQKGQRLPRSTGAESLISMYETGELWAEGFSASHRVFVRETRGQPILLRHLELDYRWEGFQLASTNDFSVNAGLMVTFDKRKFRFHCDPAGISQYFLYQEWLTEDQQKQVVEKLAKRIFDLIQAQRGNKLQS